MNTATISFPLFGEGFVLNPPAYFTIFGFTIFYYGLFITAGFALAALYLIKRSDVIGLTKDNVLDLVIIAVPAGLIGARLYYILFNFRDFFGPGSWQNIFAIREGGLAVYGGIILSGLAYILYSRRKKIPIGKLLDAAGFGLFIGQAVGRWGNFFNREAFGSETLMPWRMGFTFEESTYSSALDQVLEGGRTYYFHPTFLYEMLWNSLGLLLMHLYSKKFKTKYPGQYFLFYMAWYGFGRFIIEGLRVDSLFVPGTYIRISQLVALVSCIVSVALLIIFHVRRIDTNTDASGTKSSKEKTEDSSANTDKSPKKSKKTEDIISTEAPVENTVDDNSKNDND